MSPSDGAISSLDLGDICCCIVVLARNGRGVALDGQPAPGDISQERDGKKSRRLSMLFSKNEYRFLGDNDDMTLEHSRNEGNSR